MAEGSAPSVGPAAPPPTPFERRRRRRRTRAVVALALLALAVPLTLLVVDRQDVPASGAGAGATPVPEPDAPEPPGAGGAPGPLARPDLTDLGPADLALARVLIDVDASELAMLTYDVELAAAFGGADGGGGGGGEAPDLDAALGAAAEAAARGEAALAELATRLATPSDDGAAEAVRVAYLPHLEAWRVHMERVASAPDVLLSEGATEADTAEINVTADVFRRRLEEVLEGEVGPEVAVFAEAILDRGFRGYERDADVASPAPRAPARSAARSVSAASTRGTGAGCEPDRSERPTTATSSSTAAQRHLLGTARAAGQPGR